MSPRFDYKARDVANVSKRLNILVRLATFEGDTLELPDKEISEIAGNANIAEEYLASLHQLGVVMIDGYEEEGWQGNWWLYRGDNLQGAIRAEIATLSKQYAENNERINKLFGFDFDSLKSSVESIDGEISQIKEKLSKTEVLKPMIPITNEIEEHFGSIKTVLERFDEIYQGIIQPIQDDARRGIRHTTAWAIAGIILSTLASLAISYYFSAV